MTEEPRELTGGGIHEIVYDLLKNEKGKVLDVGAGEGAFCKLLKKNGDFSITATETNPEQFKFPLGAMKQY